MIKSEKKKKARPKEKRATLYTLVSLSLFPFFPFLCVGSTQPPRRRHGSAPLFVFFFKKSFSFFFFPRLYVFFVQPNVFIYTYTYRVGRDFHSLCPFFPVGNEHLACVTE